MAFTEHQIAKTYSAAQRVHAGAQIRARAIDDLVQIGVAADNAGICINAFKKMMVGERYERTLSGPITTAFLTFIHRDYGSKGLQTALSSLEAHILYLESKRPSKSAPQERRLLAEFSARLNKSNSTIEKEDAIDFQEILKWLKSSLEYDDGLTEEERRDIVEAVILLYQKSQQELNDITGDDHDLVKAIKGRTDIDATTKEQLVQARRGQGRFKTNISLNETGCRITKIEDPAHLRASHIKPWRESSDEEKLNGCNGLLLAPHVDHLFDKGMISFADNGDLLVSTQLDKSILVAWGIPAVLNVGPFNSEQAKFLAYHREKYQFT